MKLSDRFWSNVETGDGCWNWIGYRSVTGYGKIRMYGSNPIGAHRVSYVMHFGDIPSGMEVRHKCDNPSCVKPTHLELGTHADNMRDMKERRRAAYGQRQPHSKLNPDQVKEIRDSLARGQKLKELAQKFGVSFQLISFIKHGKVWEKCA